MDNEQKFSFCDHVTVQTLESMVMKRCAQVIRRKMTAEFINGQNCFDRFKNLKNNMS